jgi:hypothetical protein
LLSTSLHYSQQWGMRFITPHPPTLGFRFIALRNSHSCPFMPFCCLLVIWSYFQILDINFMPGIDIINEYFICLSLNSEQSTLFYILSVLGIECRAAHLLDKHSVYYLSYAPTPTVSLLHRNSYFFFFDATRVWTQGFILAMQTYYHFNHSNSPEFLIF